jgi:hypothetical protein
MEQSFNFLKIMCERQTNNKITKWGPSQLWSSPNIQMLLGWLMKDKMGGSNFMEQSPFWEDDSHSVGQEILHFLRNPKVHYCVPIKHYLEPDESNSHSISSKPILILSSHLHLGLPSSHFPSDYVTKILYAFPVSPIWGREEMHVKVCLVNPKERD